MNDTHWPPDAPAYLDHYPLRSRTGNVMAA